MKWLGEEWSLIRWKEQYGDFLGGQHNGRFLHCHNEYYLTEHPEWIKSKTTNKIAEADYQI